MEMLISYLIDHVVSFFRVERQMSILSELSELLDP